jgi:Mg2+/Co2+ transporter CorB
MLLSILDLEGVSVDDVMIPRQEIVGLDLDRPWHDNLALIQDAELHRLPVYREDIDNLLGVVLVLQLLPDLARGTLTEATMLTKMREPYFVPEGTPLNKALLNFQQNKRRSAFVVDEYGDVQGLITIQDIIREIVGELGTEPTPVDFGITQEADRSVVVDASANVRQLNRMMNWSLPTDGPKTLNGLIVEQLETIPESGTGVTVADYPIEIVDASEQGIRRVRVFPRGSRVLPKERAA